MSETLFGHFVVGPPGSGKSTYCKFIRENLKQLGRNAHIINLDPANDCLPYKPVINITDLIDVETVMKEGKCGPNGAMIHCIEVLNDNFGWLYDKIVELMESEAQEFENKRKILDDMKKNGQSTEYSDTSTFADMTKNKPFLLFDCPGQSEIYTHHTAMRELIKKLTCRHNKHFELRLVCMNLCDAYHASDLGKYISILVTSLLVMLNLELPHLNILSKVDNVELYGKTRFSLDFYTEVLNLEYLLDTEMEHPFFKKYKDLSRNLASVVQDYSLVRFIPLNIQVPEDILLVLKEADRANGYCVDDLDLSILQMNPQLIEMASGKRLQPLHDATCIEKPSLSNDSKTHAEHPPDGLPTAG